MPPVHENEAQALRGATLDMRRVHLFDLSHGEAQDLCSRGVPVYLPVNPVEYHGPHLSLRNDHLCGMGLAEDLHARIAPANGSPWPFLVASSIEAGVEPCPGPGTRAVSFLAVRRLVVDACRALLDLGARRVVIVTFHGAPLHAHALDAGVRLCEARGARAIQPHNLLMRALMTIDGSAFPEAFASIEDPAERATLMRETPRDFHAGYGETSLALHYAPESVGAIYKALPPCPPIRPDPPFVAASRAARAAGQHGLAIELEFAAHARGWMKLTPFPGYTTSPHRATSEAGRVFARAIVDRYEEATRAVFAGAGGPRPIMPWLVMATMAGNLPALDVPLDRVARFEPRTA
jgi:creatinine amidohydrolase